MRNENLWAWLKLELHQHYSDTKYLHGSPETVKGILKERLNKVRWDFGEEVINRLIESMSEHVQVVLKQGASIQGFEVNRSIVPAIKRASHGNKPS